MSHFAIDINYMGMTLNVRGMLTNDPTEPEVVIEEICSNGADISPVMDDDHFEAVTEASKLIIRRNPRQYIGVVSI